MHNLGCNFINILYILFLTSPTNDCKVFGFTNILYENDCLDIESPYYQKTQRKTVMNYNITTGSKVCNFVVIQTVKHRFL